MRLHAQVPLIAFLSLLHLRIALVRFILGRTRSVDVRRIDNGATGDSKPLRLEIACHRIEQLAPQVMSFQQVAKLAISAKNAARRAVFAYRSNPDAESVICFIDVYLQSVAFTL